MLLLGNPHMQVLFGVTARRPGPSLSTKASGSRWGSWPETTTALQAQAPRQPSPLPPLSSWTGQVWAGLQGG